jgi:hypothetical protein
LLLSDVRFHVQQKASVTTPFLETPIFVVIKSFFFDSLIPIG